MRRWKRAILAAVGSVALAPPMVLHAQRPVSLGLAGGVSLPQGGWGDGVNSAGWHALATVGVSTLMQPLGLRLDVAYNRFTFSDRAQTAFGGEGYQDVGSATANVTYRLPMTNSPLSPYLISGLGSYRSSCSRGPGCDATFRYGWNVGLGTKLHLIGSRSFIEARYHRTERGGRDVNFFPVSVGLML